MTCPLLAQGSASDTNERRRDRESIRICLPGSTLHSGSVYVGATTDLEKRYEEHCSGRACRTTAIDSPVGLVYSETFESFPEARHREAQIKRWSRAKKEALVSGDVNKLRELSKSRKTR
jgi:putative endonuclease